MIVMGCLVWLVLATGYAGEGIGDSGQDFPPSVVPGRVQARTDHHACDS